MGEKRHYPVSESTTIQTMSPQTIREHPRNLFYLFQPFTVRNRPDRRRIPKNHFRLGSRGQVRNSAGAIQNRQRL